jgi:alpha-tubulin suppressor-like RCC1 family protein
MRSWLVLVVAVLVAVVAVACVPPPPPPSPTTTTTTTVPPTPGVSAVAAGGRHSCALTPDGVVKCWGTLRFSLGGDTTADTSTTATTVTGLGPGVRAVATGLRHACAITSGGGVRCWGSNFNSQLGDGTGNDSLAPVDVAGLSSGVTAIAAGASHTCALTTGGVVKCWGAGYLGLPLDGSSYHFFPTPVDIVTLGTEVKAIAAGYYHTCAVTSTGGLKCWGFGQWGQLGNGTADSPTPLDVVGMGSGVKAVALHRDQTCAVTSSGAVKCWGSNLHGQLGNGTTSTGPNPVPVNVTGLGSGVTAITVGGSNSCALNATGTLKCWGPNWFSNNSPVGIPTPPPTLTPITVDGLGSGVLSATAADEHVCARSSTGVVKCWGRNRSGQLGNGSLSSGLITTPGDVIGLP